MASGLPASGPSSTSISGSLRAARDGGKGGHTARWWVSGRRAQKRHGAPSPTHTGANCACIAPRRTMPHLEAQKDAKAIMSCLLDLARAGRLRLPSPPPPLPPCCCCWRFCFFGAGCSRSPSSSSSSSLACPATPPAASTPPSWSPPPPFLPARAALGGLGLARSQAACLARVSSFSASALACVGRGRAGQGTHQEACVAWAARASSQRTARSSHASSSLGSLTT